MNGLTKTQQADFERNGFAGPFRAWSESEVEACRTRLERDIFPDPDNTEAIKTSASFKDQHLQSRAIFELASHPAVLDRMADLIGEDLVLWTTRFFIKEPGGAAFPWHQDRNYIESALEPAKNVTAWMALNEVDEDNGCVKILPGTHRQAVEHRSIGTNAFQGGLGEEAAITEEMLATAVPMPLRPGEFFLFNENTIHGSDANTSPRPRYGLAIRVCPASVKINITKDGYAPVVLRGKGGPGTIRPDQLTLK